MFFFLILRKLIFPLGRGNPVYKRDSTMHLSCPTQTYLDTEKCVFVILKEIRYD